MSIPLSNSRSGMNAIQFSMDALANDMANTNTTGYKSKNVSFRELILNGISDQQVLLADTAQNTAISSGVKSQISTTNFSQGSLISSPNEYHLAIEGNGFFGVTGVDGNFYLTRDGAFHVNGDKSITNSTNERLEMEELIPSAQWPDGQVSIRETGEVFIQTETNTVQVGRIPLFLPDVSAMLVPAGKNHFLVADGVQISSSIDGGAEFGTINQHYLETSNVDLAGSITDMILAQRAYSLNIKVAQSTDDMMSMTNAFKQ